MNRVHAAVIGAVVVLAAGAGGYALKSQVANPEPSPAVVVTATPTATPNLAAYSFSKVTAAPKGQSGITVIDGDIHSADSTAHSVKLRANFVDNQGKTVATATGLVSVPAMGSAHFQLFTTDFIDTYKTLDVKVEEVE